MNETEALVALVEDQIVNTRKAFLVELARNCLPLTRWRPDMVTGCTVHNSLRIGLTRLLETAVVQGDCSWGSIWGAGSDGALVMRQPTNALGSISCPVRSCCSHLECGALFPLSLYLAVIVPGVWVLYMSTKIGFFGR